jgi:hypothetical protein
MSSLIFARVVRSLPPEEARGKTDRVKSAECPTNVKEVVARFGLGGEAQVQMPQDSDLTPGRWTRGHHSVPRRPENTASTRGACEEYASASLAGTKLVF